MKKCDPVDMIDTLTRLLAEHLGVAPLDPEQRRSAMLVLNDRIFQLDVERINASHGAVGASVDTAVAEGKTGYAASQMTYLVGVCNELKAVTTRHDEARRRLHRSPDGAAVDTASLNASIASLKAAKEGTTVVHGTVTVDGEALAHSIGKTEVIGAAPAPAPVRPEDTLRQLLRDVEAALAPLRPFLEMLNAVGRVGDALRPPSAS